MLVLAFIVLVNLIFILFSLVLRNQIDRSLISKRFAIILIIFSLLLILAITASGFSIENFGRQWSTVLDYSMNMWYTLASIIVLIYVILLVPFLYRNIKSLLIPNNRIYVYIILGYILVGLAIWLQFGFSSVGHREIWSYRHFLLYQEPNIIKIEMLRRLTTAIPHILGHVIDPVGFTGYNLLHLCAFIAKGILLFGILSKLRIPIFLCFTTSLLFMIYPTSTEIMSLRSYIQVIRVDLYLFATYVFLVYIETPSRLCLALFFIAMFTAVTSIEYPYFLILIFPTLLLLHGNPIRKVIDWSIIWFVIPVWGLVYQYFTITSSTTSEELTDFHFAYTTINEELLQIAKTVERSYSQLLLANWQAAFTIEQVPQYLLTTVGISIVMAFLGYQLTRQLKPVRLSRTAIAKLIMFGLVSIVCTTMLLALSPRLRDSDWRIYTFGAIGATITVSGIFYLFASILRDQRKSQLLFLAISIILFSIGFNSSIHQYHDYWVMARYKENFIQFVSEYERITPDSYWLVFSGLSKTEIDEKLGIFSEQRMKEQAFRLLTNQDDFSHIFFCYKPSGQCKFHQKQLDVTLNPYLPSERIPYDNIAFFWINEDLTVELLETLPSEPWEFVYANDTYQPFTHVRPNS